MKGGITMNFVKGAMIGMAAGTMLGVMNKNKIMKMVKDGKRKIYRMKKYGFNF